MTSASASPPEWTYWLSPNQVLCGCYPGAIDAQRTADRIDALVEVGVRTFINLMEADELNNEDDRFRSYVECARHVGRKRDVEVVCQRYPIPDFGIPTLTQVDEILNAIRFGVERGVVYLHCWGGVGRTGTIACCWLLEQEVAERDTVFDVLAIFRQMDRVRGCRPSPETIQQRQFVEEWANIRG